MLQVDVRACPHYYNFHNNRFFPEKSGNQAQKSGNQAKKVEVKGKKVKVK